jgi:hypothetical protein
LLFIHFKIKIALFNFFENIKNMKSTCKKTLIMIQLFIVFQILNVSYGILNKKSLRIDKHLINKIRMLDEVSTDVNSEDDTTDDSSSLDISSDDTNGTQSDSTKYDNSTTWNRKSSSSGLSTGAICAIAIPCVAALIGVAAAAALCKGSAAPQIPIQTSPPPINYIDTSLDKFNAVQEIPQQPVQIVQPEPQPQVVEVMQPQPQPQIIRPNYPINTKLDPPAVNRAFQPMYPTQQIGGQMNMIPVQKVEMVPVEQVEMVPVKEVVPVNQVGAMQQAVPIQQVTNIHQGVESVPQISQVSSVPGVQMMPEIQNVGSGIVSQPQNIQSGIQQVPGKIMQGSEILPGQSFP